MNRPPVEVADIVRASSARFLEKSGRWLHWSHVKVLRAIARCRTAALGGHRDQCPKCGHQAISYNSCLMGSIFLWGVGRQKGMLQHGIMPFVLSIKTWS
jgi:hypothetical protein